MFRCWFQEVFNTEDPKRGLKYSPKQLQLINQAPEIEFVFLWLCYLKDPQKMGQTESFINTQFCHREDTQTFTILYQIIWINQIYSNYTLEDSMVHSNKNV